jgi:hypothetical protein
MISACHVMYAEIMNRLSVPLNGFTAFPAADAIGPGIECARFQIHRAICAWAAMLS